jgi:hypothetical protein
MSFIERRSQRKVRLSTRDDGIGNRGERQGQWNDELQGKAK